MSFLCLADDYTAVGGTTGPGAEYIFYVPDSWNGEVVYFAHGFEDPAFPPYIFDQPKDVFLSRGYAFAVSSYSASGWAVEEAARQMHQLRGLFASKFGKPKRSYIAGGSMGGIITVALAEKNGQQYDGAMPTCGCVGGTKMSFDAPYNTTILFNYYYPGVMPGEVFYIPDGLDLLFDFIIPYNQAIAVDPSGLYSMAAVDQLNITYDNFNELANTVFSRLLARMLKVNNDLDRTHGHMFFDNTDTMYTGSLSPGELEALNNGVERFASAPDAENYIRHHYEPTGKIRTRVLTLHNARDPMVPIEQEGAFYAVVNAAGYGDFLAQKYVDNYGHCNFSEIELGAAFDELVEWVEFGDDHKPDDGLLQVP